MDRSIMGMDLYPEQPVDFFSVEYHMDDNLYHDASLLKLLVIGLFGSPGMTTDRIERPFRELQEF